jgi:hypothetical protein
MRNILFVLSLSVLMFLLLTFMLGVLDRLDPLPVALIRTYFGVSPVVALRVVLGVVVLAGVGAYWTGLRKG